MMEVWKEKLREAINEELLPIRDTAHLGPFTTVRACAHCGVFVSGGPTACAYCVERLALLEPPAQGRKKR